MKKIRINIIVLLVSLAMVALLIIQLFQTKQLYERKAEQFKKHVQTVLDRIAIHHEKAEDIKRYMQVVNKDFNVKYKDILKKEFQNLLSTEEKVMVKDTSIYEGGEIKKYIVIQGKAFDTLSGLRTEHKVLVKDVTDVNDLLTKHKPKLLHQNDSSSLYLAFEQRMMQQLFKKAKFINDVLMSAFKENTFHEATKRVDLSFLDSVIKHELKQDNLPLNYKFAISSSANEILTFEQNKVDLPKAYERKIDTLISPKTVLYPQDLLNEKLNLYLFFPNQKHYIFKEMIFMLSINLCLLLIIIVAFIFMFKTILTQKKLNELKTDFISNMTHEFKTPISTISLACEALQDKSMVAIASEQQTPFVNMIKEENKRLENLVERILQSAVIDRGELKLNKEQINLNELIQSICLSVKLKLSSVNGTITKLLPNNELYINADKTHTHHIILNLIDNAIKYSKESPKITIELSEQTNDYVLSVSDEGIGMSKEHLSKIFDKLYRIPTGNVHNVKGFGLGLSYVKAIVDLNDWKIKVTSKPDQGSTFTILIPKN